MKRNSLTIAVGAVLVLVFAMLLFVFQVRKSYVAVVTTFGKPVREITEPGLYFKLPWPIQSVHKLDQRIQNWESKLEQSLTADNFSLLVSVYAGWKISQPSVFFPKFNEGSVVEAEKVLDGLIRSAKNEVLGLHPFKHFISANEKELQFTEIEVEMLKKVQDQLKSKNYGIEVAFLGIQRLGLPESVTKKVFERMTAERELLATKINSEGEEQARKIRDDAFTQSAKLLAEADAQAVTIRGEGEAAAARSFSVFKQNPELANLLFKLAALEMTLKEKTTMILDQSTPPLDLLNVNASSKK